MEIFAGGSFDNVTEYNDTAEYGVTIPNTKGYGFWENLLFESQKGNFNFKIYQEKLVSIDLHSSSIIDVAGNKRVLNFWDRYSKLKKGTNLNYKDLLGAYRLDSCSTNAFQKKSPVYKKVLDDGTEAYLYKANSQPNHWQVTKIR